MNYLNIPYRIFPLGDSAITVDFGNVIDEAVNCSVPVVAFGPEALCVV